MKKPQRIFKLLALGCVVLFGSGLKAQQTAQLQAIHNSPHPTASSVDIWVSTSTTATKLLSDFGFREATPFVPVAAGIPVTVSVALPGSTSINDTVPGLSVTTQLTAGERYVLLAQGNVDNTGYASNPDGINTSFQFVPVAGIRSSANDAANVDFLVVHGSPDAPVVDVYAQGIGTPLISDLQFNQSSNYLSVPADVYFLDITVAGTTTPVFVKKADLSGLAGGVATVFASGYLTPSANNDGPSFGLFAALADGTVVELTDPVAQVQVIHNAADPGAASVDVYINDDKALSNFDFRAATPYLDLPARRSFNVGIAPAGSNSVNDVIATFTYNLEDNQAYLLVANGVLNPANFTANPDGISIAFDLFPFTPARQEAEDAESVDLIVFHGATDAPVVDVLANGSVLIDDLGYGAYQGYASVPAAEYVLGITPGNDNNTVLVRYAADLSGLAGSSVSVLASGFLDPAANDNGEGFVLIAVLADGTVIELPVYTPQAEVQIVHNAADPAAASVDVYLNGAILLPDFAFRTATPFVSVDAETLISVGIAPANSTSADDTLVNFDFNLPDGGKFIIVANGVLAPANFASNPDGLSTGFNLFVQPGARSESEESNKVDVLVFHGATDAPEVDILVEDNVLVPALSYTQFAGYLSVDPAEYILTLTPAGDNDNIIVGYDADLSALEGNSITVIATGFLSPDDNNDGEAFGLMAVLANGDVVMLPEAELGSVANLIPVSGSLYPNPAQNQVVFRTMAFETAQYKVVNIAGQEVLQGTWNAHNPAISLDSLSNGLYFVELIQNQQVFRAKLQVSH